MDFGLSGKKETTGANLIFQDDNIILVLTEYVNEKNSIKYVSEEEEKK